MKALNIFKKTICYSFIAMMAFIWITVIFASSFVDFFLKKEFCLPNFVLLLIGLLAIAAFGFIGIACKKYFAPFVDNLITRRSILLAAILGFFAQCYICYNFYFLTGWDVGVIFHSAATVATGGEADSAYLSQYPNNVFLVLFYSSILKINSSIGIFTENSGIFSLIVLQCLFSAIVAYLVYSITYEFTGHKEISAFAFLLYSFYVGLSPWFSIPYSDATGILFPILTFRVWQMSKSTESVRKKIILYLILGALSFVAFKIKPQTFIIAIAILIFEVLKTICLWVKEKKFPISATKLCLFISMFLLSSMIFSSVAKSTDAVTIDEEREFGISHFFMMGLYEETHGVWNEVDVGFSASHATKEERDKANINVAIERIKSYGVGGLFKHVSKKTMLNFGDGTFAWGGEGNFFINIQNIKNSEISPFIRSFYYRDGENYGTFINLSQILWLTVLSLSSLSALYSLKNKSKRGEEATVLILSIIGLTLFETLFEPRARYLFTYAPIFIICACIGLFSVLKEIKQKGLIK